MIATQNTLASLYSILTYQIKFPLPLPGYQIFKNFPTTSYNTTHSAPPPPAPPLIKFWRIFYPSPVYSNSPPPSPAPSIRHSTVVVFRTPSNILVNYFCKKLHLRCLTGFWIRLWHKTFFSDIFLHCRAIHQNVKNVQQNFIFLPLYNVFLVPTTEVYIEPNQTSMM